MISAKELIDLLEARDLVPEELVGHLRQKISEAQVPSAAPPWNKPITAARLAKWLVDNGHLSRLLAQRLLAKAEGQGEVPTAEPAPPTAMPAPPTFASPVARRADEGLDLAPLDEDEARKQSPKKQPAPPAKPPVKKAAKRAEELPLAAPVAPRVEKSLFDEELPAAAPAEATPLGSLMEGLPLDAASAAGPLEALPVDEQGPSRASRGRRGDRSPRRKDNVWDSPLLLVGGGALLLLVIGGGALYWWMFVRQIGDEMLAAANDFYNQGSYANAIENYNRYLDKFPEHKGASLARVHRGLAQLLQATDSASNWPAALRTADGVTGRISGEAEFAAEGRPELAALLPKIAKGLATQALADLDPEMVEQTHKALALVDRYVPKSMQPETELQNIQDVLALAEREIDQGKKLKEATAAMLAAIAAEKPQEAYAIRNALLREYPRLVDDPELHKAVLAVGQAEQAAVKTVANEVPAATDEPPIAALATVTLANRLGGGTAAGLAGQTVFATADGAVYGLDAASGKVLWRRAVGLPESVSVTSFPPTPLGDTPGSDVLLVDHRHPSLLRVEAATGRLRWRHAIGEPLDAQPVLSGDRVLVATRSGRIVQIELASGNSPGYVQLQQSLGVAPAVDRQRSKLYQVADHSNLFVLSLPDGKALETVYLGHHDGDVVAAPVVVSRYLVLAKNDRAAGATLVVLSLDPTASPESKEAGESEPPASVRVLQEVQLDGHVDAPPLVSGLRVLVVTDTADIHVFEISASKPDAPLLEVARSKAGKLEGPGDKARRSGGGTVDAETVSFAPLMIRYPLMVGNQVWIADSQLTRYDVQPARVRLEPKGIQNDGSVTVEPPVAMGDIVVHVRRKTHLPGVLVSAMPRSGGRAVWETQLAAPLVSEPEVDSAGAVTAVSMLGDAFSLSADEVERSAVIDRPAATLPPTAVRRPMTAWVPLESGRAALAAVDGPPSFAVLDWRQSPRIETFTLPDALGCAPVGSADGLLAPCKSGQAILLDLQSGKPTVEPFQPSLGSDAAVDWRAAAAIGQREFVLADGRGKLYRVGVKSAPTPHLAQLAAVDLTESIVSPIAVLDTVAYAVDASNSLSAFELPGLGRGKVVPLGGRPVWGPRRVGDRVMLTTDGGRLYCLDAAQNVVWQVALTHGPLAGTPLVTDGGIVLVAESGVVWRIDSATGDELAKLDTGYSLATGAVALPGDRLLVAGHDGTLYAIERP